MANVRDDGASIVGGAFSTGDAYPEEYRGRYFYADFSYGWLRYVAFDEDMNLVGERVE